MAEAEAVAEGCNHRPLQAEVEAEAEAKAMSQVEAELTWTGGAERAQQSWCRGKYAHYNTSEPGYRLQSLKLTKSIINTDGAKDGEFVIIGPVADLFACCQFNAPRKCTMGTSTQYVWQPACEHPHHVLLLQLAQPTSICTCCASLLQACTVTSCRSTKSTLAVSESESSNQCFLDLVA